MPKLYNKPTPESLKTSGPRPETIQRILSFSKALSVIKVNHMTFETLNN
ncbi:hypothetical protein SAMN05192588_1200 [Nonlabens sp. Hel1_33_55]|nr:hypothetical protein [Nonlabens sp. Hel1_33_55]SCY11111.1 hypothetical protein SAMN05192588_1200 [Nonlabens sp. Hel1_33_55]